MKWVGQKFSVAHCVTWNRKVQQVVWKQFVPQRCVYILCAARAVRNFLRGIFWWWRIFGEGCCGLKMRFEVCDLTLANVLDKCWRTAGKKLPGKSVGRSALETGKCCWL